MAKMGERAKAQEASAGERLRETRDIYEKRLEHVTAETEAKVSRCLLGHSGVPIPSNFGIIQNLANDFH